MLVLSLLALLEEGFHFLEDFFIENLAACKKYLIRPRVVLGKIQMLLSLKEKSKKRTDNKKMRFIANIFFG